MPQNAQWQAGVPLSSQSTSSLEYSHSNGYTEGGGGSKEPNEQPKEYRSVFEYKMAQINKSYSSSGLPNANSSFTSPSSNDSNITQSRDSSSRRPWRSNHNYENVSMLENNKPNTTLQSSSSSMLDNRNQNRDRVNNNPAGFSSNSNYRSQDDAYLGGVQVPPSSTGLRYSHSMGQVDKPAHVNTPGDSSIESTPSKAGNSRTNSWTEGNTSESSGRQRKQGKVNFPASFNTRIEDKIKSKDTKRHLQEMRMRSSPKDSPTRPQPMLAKKDSLGEMGRVFKFDESSTKDLMQHGVGKSDATGPTKVVKDSGTSPPLPTSPPPQLTPPKRLHQTAPKLSSKSSSKDGPTSIIDEHKWDVVQTPSAGYMYIVRQKPCYNTSTQTEGTSTEGPPPPMSPLDTSPAPVAKEERGIQARPGSIVAATLSQTSLPLAKSSGAGTHEGPQEQLPVTPKRHTSSGSDVSDPRSPNQPKYWIHEDDMAKINENPDQSDMLRKLSQEYFGKRRFSGSSKNLHKISGNTVEDTKQRRKSAEFDSRYGAELSLASAGAGEYAPDPLSPSWHPSTHEGAIAVKSEFEPQGLSIKKLAQVDGLSSGDPSDRHLRSSSTDKRPTSEQTAVVHNHGKSNSTSSAYVSTNRLHSQQNPALSPSFHQDLTYGGASTTENIGAARQRSDSSSSATTRQIAERARMEYIESGEFQRNGGLPKPLQRAVSEQIRPFQDRQRSYGGVSEQTDMNESIELPSSHNTSLSSYQHKPQTSDISMDHSSPSHVTMRTKRLSSDSDMSGVIRGGKSFDARGQRLSSARSSSSGSGHSREEDRNKANDHELRRLQQQALLNFYENKTGKRMSSSSMDSSTCSDVLGIPKTNDKQASSSPDWRGGNKSPYRTDEASITSMNAKLTKKSSTTSIELPSRRSSSGGSGYESMRSSIKDGVNLDRVAAPPEVDIASSIGSRGYHSHTSSGATTASSMSPRGEPYSPPLHPWADMAKVSEEGETNEKQVSAVRG